jgi:hypothetical protein
MSIEQIINDTWEAYNLNWKLDVDCTGLYVATSEDTDITYYIDMTNKGLYRVARVTNGNDEHFTYKHPKSVIAFIGRYENPTLLRNSAKCLVCLDVLVSLEQHDFNSCSCGNLSVDGGKAYTKRLCKGGRETYKELSLCSDSPHGELRDKLERGGRGIDGRQPLTWVKIKDINDNWLNSLITYCEDLGQYGSIHYLMYLDELEYRRVNNIIVTGE